MDIGFDIAKRLMQVNMLFQELFLVVVVMGGFQLPF